MCDGCGGQFMVRDANAMGVEMCARCDVFLCLACRTYQRIQHHDDVSYPARSLVA
eukprot:gene8207-36022_t